MTHFAGTTGADVLRGTSARDVFDISQGGNDTVSGGLGDDVIFAGSAFTADDTISGGHGDDTLALDGGGTFDFGPASLRSVENIALISSGTFDLVLDDGNVAPERDLIIRVNHATANVDASAETDGFIVMFDGSDNGTFVGGGRFNSFYGGNGDDTATVNGGGVAYYGGQGDDVLDARTSAGGEIFGGGGNDGLTVSGGCAAYGGGGSDEIAVWAPLDSTVRGGRGYDSLWLYDGQVFDHRLDVRHLGFEYVTVAGGVVGTNERDVINFSGVDDFLTMFFAGAGDDLVHGGESGNWMVGDGGDDKLFGGAGGDSIDGGTGRNVVYGGDDGDALGIPSFSDGPGGHTTYYGGAGDDLMFGTDGHFHMFGDDGDDRIGFGNTVVKEGALDGGDGVDTLDLSGGSYLTEPNIIFDMVAFDAVSTHMETLITGSVRGSNGDNALDFSGFTVVGDVGMEVSGRGGNDVLVGTTLADRLNGDAGNDRLIGGAGADALTGGKGADVYAFAAVADSTGAAHDTIAGFDAASGDAIDLWFTVGAVEAPIRTGTLSQDSFDADLAAAVGAAALGAHDAVVFTPDAGTLAGTKFLIVDANGTAGYQAGEDLVIQISGPDLRHLDAAAFA